MVTVINWPNMTSNNQKANRKSIIPTEVRQKFKLVKEVSYAMHFKIY